METSQVRRSNNVESGENRVEDLHLDRVVASQPEIGPTPPDGGYGWLIVISAMVYNITVPSIFTLYGFVILKSIREEDHDVGEAIRLWDVDIALVPILMVVIKLLLESWCRAIVKVFNMPRFMALSGLCMTVAGVLLSSYSTDINRNDQIINIFAAIFAGAGCALTGQQTDVIVTHFFREKVVFAQRLVKISPYFGNCIVPIMIGLLCRIYPADTVVMIYGAILMQNCFFLAAYTRPVYREKVIRNTYNALRDAVEDEDEEIFSNQSQNRGNNAGPVSNPREEIPQAGEPNRDYNDDDTDVVVFKSNKNAKEIIEPSTDPQRRFSSDFSTSFPNTISANRFSSDFTNRFSSDFGSRFSTDFGSLQIAGNDLAYQELETIDRTGQNPQPLYRETTVNASRNSLVFPTEMTQGTARRTASMKKNFITIMSILVDINFYLYALLYLTTTFSSLMLGVIFPPLIWEHNPEMNIWGVAVIITVANSAAMCFIALCVALPKNINEKFRLCTLVCIFGAAGFYGITLSSSRVLLVVWCLCASVSTAASGILQQPLYNSLNEFDTTATHTAANSIAAVFIMIWSICFNYTFKACFLTASILQVITACAFFASSFRRRR